MRCLTRLGAFGTEEEGQDQKNSMREPWMPWQLAKCRFINGLWLLGSLQYKNKYIFNRKFQHLWNWRYCLNVFKTN